MRYFTKLTVEYCRIFVINCIFAAVMTFNYMRDGQ